MFSFFESLIDPYEDAKQERMPGNSPMRFILYFARQAPFIFLAILIFGGLQAWIEITLFGFVGETVDMLETADAKTVFEENWPTFVWMIIFVGLIRVAVMAMGALIIEQTIAPSFFSLVRWQSHKNVIRQSLTFFQNDFAGRIATKVVQSGQAVADFLITLLDTVWLIVLYMISTAVLFFGLDWRLTVFLCVWATIYGFVLRYFVPRIRKNARRVADAKSQLTGRLVDGYSNVAIVKVDSRPEREDAFIAGGLNLVIGAVRGFGRTVTGLRICVVINNSIMLIGVAYLMLSRWQVGEVSIGEIAFVFSLALRLNLLANRFQGQINGIFRNYGQAQDSMRTVAQDIDLLDKPSASELHVSKGGIAFQDVSFKYSSRDDGDIVINDLSFSVAPGEKVGLVGPSGAGKSTLVNLLLRMYDLDSGKILIDGQAVDEVTQVSLRSSIGLVSQDTSLLHRSIRENIAFARPDASDEEIIEAARWAQAWDFIKTLEDGKGRTGLDAFVGERGVKLSGGQRQRIAIARVLLKNAPILILDEATSALDSQVEAVLQQNLAELMEGKTVIAIAHRLSTIAAMDRLIVIDQGEVVESGTHGELLELNGLYASLWARQSGGFIQATV